MPLLLGVSRSSLAHAALAHLTPEFLTFDDIIQSPSSCRLPVELLLIVRTCLLPQLAASLIAESAEAILSYEKSLKSLLCSDCTSYNTDIYGADVWDWPWDQFSGPCLCGGDIDDCLKRSKAFTDTIAQLHCDADKDLYTRYSSPLFHRVETGEVFSKGKLLQFSPQLLDVHFILELHLSRQARRLARLAFKASTTNRSWCGPTLEASPVNGLIKVRSIWDAVVYVLRGQYGCEALETSNRRSLPATPSNSTKFGPTAPQSTAATHRNLYDTEIVELEDHVLDLLPRIIAAVPSTEAFSRPPPPTHRQRDDAYISLYPNMGSRDPDETNRTKNDAVEHSAVDGHDSDNDVCPESNVLGDRRQSILTPRSRPVAAAAFLPGHWNNSIEDPLVKLGLLLGR